MNNVKQPVAATHTARRTPLAPPQLKLPHEHDESIGAVGPATCGFMEPARRNLQAGQVDTDMRATPRRDAPRRRRLVTSAPS